MSILRTLPRLTLKPTSSTLISRSTFHSSTVKMVQIEKISPGDGKTFPKPGDTVTMHYIGTLAKDGSEFDSSRKPGRGAFETQIGVGRVIQGWDQGVPQLSLGERAKLIIPSNEGYGSRGAGGVIPPNADLIFDVELLKINGKSA
ncbi:FK506-binding protein 1 [Pseudozyma hubeiensis]|nr:FK506-binding protein 1 [Pseudozyma hubeiensis]